MRHPYVVKDDWQFRSNMCFIRLSFTGDKVTRSNVSSASSALYDLYSVGVSTPTPTKNYRKKSNHCLGELRWFRWKLYEVTFVYHETALVMVSCTLLNRHNTELYALMAFYANLTSIIMVIWQSLYDNYIVCNNAVWSSTDVNRMVLSYLILNSYDTFVLVINVLGQLEILKKGHHGLWSNGYVGGNVSAFIPVLLICPEVIWALVTWMA